MFAKKKISVLVPLVLALLALAMVAASPASAQVEPPETSVGNSLLDDDHIVVETFTLAGDRIDTRAYGRDDAPIPIPDDFESLGTVMVGASTLAKTHGLDLLAQSESWLRESGNGGSSSTSGCIRVTVRNEKQTNLGFTAYYFNTWTSWCWNRNSQTIYNVSTGHSLVDVDSQFVWHGLVVDDTYFYSWLTGYVSSGYWHEKQGHFENCTIYFGCIGHHYPRNVLKSHSNGTWRWETHN